MKRFILLAAFLLAFVASAIAQPRIGFMNPQIVLDNLPESASIERQLNRFLDEKETEFEEMAIRFQNQLARFQQEAANLSESESQRRQQELQELDSQLEQFQNQTRFELEQRQSELLGPVLREMNRVIEEIATERRFDYVLNEATTEGEMFLLYISEAERAEYDITDEVIARMTN